MKKRSADETYRKPAVILPHLSSSLNVVTDVKERTHAEGVQEQGVKIT